MIRPFLLSTLSSIIFAQDGAYAPHVEPASPEGGAAAEGFEIPAGISIELFAAEPMLANPVCFYADHQGDFYVGETFRHYAGVIDMRDHMDWLDEDLASLTVADRLAMIRNHEGEDYDPVYGTEHERVRLIRDTDGDGFADSAVVFADGFKDHAAGIGAGLLSYQGAVYYSCIPDLWLLRDEDGDGVSDARRKLSTGYGVNVALLGHDLHGLRIGPDRRLYFSCGDRGFHVETDDGVLAHAHTGAVLRCELDGSGLEVWHSGLRNPQELVFDAHGNLWTGDNNSDGGDQARWVNVVEGGESGWRYSYQWITAPVMRGPWNDEKLWHPHFPGQAAYLVPPIANLASGPAGLTYYPGTGLSSEYDGHFFLCDFRGDAAYSGIHTFTVQPRGAFWELGPVTPFVWKTLVTDCDFAPDGALYFTDWVQGWNKTGKGRLYRAFDPAVRGSALVRETQALLKAGMGERGIEELARLLGHADQRVRQEAHFALADRGREGTAALVAVAAGSGPRLARLHAIWGLGIAGRTRPDGALAPLLALLADADVEVRAQAVRVLGDERWAPATKQIAQRIGDDEPRVRFFAALASGRLRNRGALGALVALLDETGETDPNLRHAGVMGLFGCSDDAALRKLAEHRSANVRMAVLLVLRRQESPSVARFLTDADPLIVLEAARAVHDVPIPAALPALARKGIPVDAQAALARRILNARFRLGDAERVARIALRVDLDHELRSEALEMLGEWPEPAARDRVVNAWRPIEPRAGEAVVALAPALAEKGLRTGPDELAPAFAQLAVSARSNELAPLFVELSRATERSAPVRVAALRALRGLEAPELGPAARAALHDTDGRVRAEALTALEGLAPGEALPSLPEILRVGELPERRAAYRILGRSGDARALALLASELERLAAGLLAAELQLDLVAAIEACGDAELAQRLARANAGRQADPELAPWLDALFGGDSERGQDVFQRPDLSCVRCHTTDVAGAPQVGPSLAGVSRRLSRLQLLESIVAPNRRTTPGYAATVFFLRAGGIVNGRVVEDTPERILVLDSDGEIVEVDPGAVEERRPDLSAMPEDLPATLAPDDMRDLLAYLATL